MEEIGSSPVFKLLILFKFLILFIDPGLSYSLTPTPAGDSSFRWEKNILEVNCHPELKDVVASLNEKNMSLLGNCIIPQLICTDFGEFDSEISMPLEWAYGSQVLAITKNSYDLKKGRIVYSMIELNSAKLENYPVENTLNHEIGHMLGLGHSNDREATMHESALPGEVKKASLNSDDIEALCYLYSLESGKVDFDSSNCVSSKILPGSVNNNLEFYCESVDLQDGTGGCMLIPEKPLNPWRILFFLCVCALGLALRSNKAFGEA